MNLEHCTERWESLGDDRLKRACKLAYHIEKCLGVKTTNSFGKFWMPCCSNWFADFTCEHKPTGIYQNRKKLGVIKFTLIWYR